MLISGNGKHHTQIICSSPGSVEKTNIGIVSPLFSLRWDTSLIQSSVGIWRTDWAGTSFHSTCGTSGTLLVKWLRLRGFLLRKIYSLMISPTVKQLKPCPWTSYLDQANMDKNFLPLFLIYYCWEIKRKFIEYVNQSAFANFNRKFPEWENFFLTLKS